MPVNAKREGRVAVSAKESAREGFPAGGLMIPESVPRSDYTSKLAGFSSKPFTVARYAAAIAPSMIR